MTYLIYVKNFDASQLQRYLKEEQTIFLHGRLITYLVCDIINNDGGLGSSIIHGRQTVISLLSRRVPDFELHRRVVQADSLCEERRCKNGSLHQFHARLSIRMMEDIAYLSM